jgi:hypothetical protein
MTLKYVAMSQICRCCKRAPAGPTACSKCKWFYCMQCMSNHNCYLRPGRY